MISYKTFDQSLMVTNINCILSSSTSEEIQAGRQWYKTASAFCATLSGKHNKPLAVVAGIVAALSPETTWTQNIIDAEAVLLLGDAATVTTYSRNKDKAIDILTGDIEPVAHYASKHIKTACFFTNILKPLEAGRVTIDRHAARIAHGYYLKSSEAIYYCNTKQKYTATEAAYTEAATEAGLLPHELQAVTWLTYRRLFVTRKRQEIDLSTYNPINL